MITLHDALHATIEDLERSFDDTPRPKLHAAARRHRTTVRVASGAAASAAGLGLGLGGFATWQLAIDGPLAAPPGAQATTELGPSLGDPGSSQVPAPVYDFAGEFVVATPGSEITVEGVRVDVYFDAMCPYCAVFAREYEGAVLEREGVTLVVHPIAFLDRFSSDGDFSTRAASAVTQVAVEAPAFAYAFLEQYWAQQPEEGSTLSDEDLMLIAAEVGVPSEVWTTFPEHRYADVVAQATQAAADSGVTWAPYVVVDGVVIETEGDLGLAVDEALDAAFAAR